MKRNSVNSFDAISVATMFDHLGQTDASNVILWGRGYGGALAVFARKKYPHLIDAVNHLIHILHSHYHEEKN